LKSYREGILVFGTGCLLPKVPGNHSGTLLKSSHESGSLSVFQRYGNVNDRFNPDVWPTIPKARSYFKKCNNC